MKDKKNTKIAYISLVSVLIIGLIFISSYYLFINTTDREYIKSIKSSIKNINGINNSTINYIKGQSIDVEKCKKELPNKINSLVKYKNKLTSLTPPEKYMKSHGYLINGLNNNIHIYEQMLSILNNPISKDINKSSESLKKYKNECMHYYSLFTINNNKITLSENSLKYINNCNYYIDELVTLTKDMEIKNSQYIDYINDIDDIISCFIEIKIDFSSYRDKIKNKSISYESTLKNIDNIKNEFEEIKNKFSKVSVPPKGITSYKLLSKPLTVIIPI